jgi:hypothetical protein
VSGEIGFFEAYETALRPLFLARNALSLISSVHAVGVTRALREPAGVRELAATVGLDETRTADVCAGLHTLGVVEHAGSDRYRLTPAWLALTAPGAFVPLDVALAGNAVESRLLASATAPTYWAMPAADRLVYARAISPDPYSDALVAAFGRQLAADPERAAILAGGRMLELGCGVAGRLLTTLRAAPRLSGVGVELSEDLAAEARRRADDLGLSERVTIICGDAAGYRGDEPFEFGFWSQFFFPERSRATALRALHANLRSGGVAFAPLGVDHAEIAADPDGTKAQAYAVWRVIVGSWGVPERTGPMLVDEFVDAGFVDVRVVERGGEGPVVRATRP